MEKTPPPNDLLKKILELEESQEHLKQEMSRLKVSSEIRQRSHSVSPHRPARKSGAASFPQSSRLHGPINLRGGGGRGTSAGKFTDNQYLNILQSVGQTSFNAVQKLLSKTNGKLVGHLMTPAPVVVEENTNLEDAEKILLETKYRRLPVVDSDGKLMAKIRQIFIAFNVW
ncbi:unnamed protein product [Eruca vesicaria subsp. sativa]|uniref:CBS domain-containing protein n=1 Tax=Eruca vesicaria subsp. sativa TaxID=29727 RepID=A0ABC8M7J9_ERUVS|nr:unnamed protein product [Eruca vesicaria subsp. sativa]